MRWRSDPLPFGIALLALGAGVAVVTFLSLSTLDVSYARTEWMVRLSMLLAAPALVLYLLDRPLGSWWRSFWTVGLLAYLLHLWWAVFRSFQGDLGAIVERQGWVAYANLAVTVLWVLDVVIAWISRASGGAARATLRFLAWAAVAASFISASVVFRWGEPVAYLGGGLAGLLVLAILVRAGGIGALADPRQAD
jgi:hypothetical protein